MAESFLKSRRSAGDAFWLKENAEFLNILECTSDADKAFDIGIYSDLYEGIESRASFFRPYYRFYLSICLDLEDLGRLGDSGERLANWVLQEDLVQAELSDLQRAETSRLLSRRNVGSVDLALNDRLRAFASASGHFAQPNTKIGYELTHIVFYLSEYGRVDPELPAAARVSLFNVGILAYLDQNLDLLAEVAIALRFARVEVPQSWRVLLASSMARYRFRPEGFDGTYDDYHAYFMGAWWALLCGDGGFDQRYPGGACAIQSVRMPGAMRPLSQLIYNDQTLQSMSWDRARPRVMARLPQREGKLIAEVERSVPEFGRFFESFARRGSGG